MSDDSILSKIFKTMNSIIWDLPFENYHKYYKTGIIQKMSNQEKIDFFFERNRANAKKTHFKKLVIMRPNILDDEDLIKYNEVISKSKKHKGIYLSLFIINSFIHFALMIKNKKSSYIKSMLATNILLTIFLPLLNIKTDQLHNDLYNKYRLILNEDEMAQKFREAHLIE
jgi:hypothetical protein